LGFRGILKKSSHDLGCGEHCADPLALCGEEHLNHGPPSLCGNFAPGQMKEQILEVIKKAIGDDAPIELSVPEEATFGHYSTNIAMRLAKARGKKPLELAQELATQIGQAAPPGFFEKVEVVAPGFVNFWLSKKTLQDEFEKISGDERYGVGEHMKNKTVMVEFTDPNPFKLFHIGHLMSNAIGESLSRLYEASGAKVVRANYQGDVGLHVAKAIWGMERAKEKMPGADADPLVKMNFLGDAYVDGAAAYESEPQAKEATIAINEKIYSRSDDAINKLYDAGREWSLAYFETVYSRLGTKFDQYFFESEMAKEGAEIVRAHPDIFIPSEGAIIFPGEKYGLHTRVFINAKGLPTYEAKELGLNKKKFELYPSLDVSVIVTGSEVIDYFRVLLRAMELVLPYIAAKTKHVSHGMLRLPGGKMSSRTGDVITAEELLAQITTKLREHVSVRTTLDPAEQESALETMAVGAIKYSILRQSPGQDIIFDFEKSLSVEGDSGPYVQYAYARLKSILRKADGAGTVLQANEVSLLDSENELNLMRKIFEFPDVVSRAGELNAPSGLVSYLYKLAVASNKFYETTPILKDENESRRNARLALVATAAKTLQSGLALLGIKTLEKI
jgi:arginyl-tRNA synthetase